MARSGSFSTFLKTVNEPSREHDVEPVTERMVLRLLLDGRSTGEIAEELALPVTTVVRVMERFQDELDQRKAELGHGKD